MTIFQILTALRARWRLALAVFVGVIALVDGVSLLRTPQYAATASVVLDVKSPDPIAGVVLPGMTVPGYMGTQLGVMQSERVSLSAIHALGLQKEPLRQAAWKDATDGQGDFESWLSDSILRKLDVLPARDSNVIMVTYTSPDPAFSAAVANAFVKAYIDTTVDLRVEPAKQYNTFFDGRSKDKREALERAQVALSTFQQKNGLLVNDERLDVENSKLAELTTQLVVQQGLATDSGSRQSQSSLTPDRMQEALSSPLVISMASDLSRQEGRLNELSVRLGDSNPQVVELRTSIGQLRARIAEETRRVASSLAINNSVNQTRLAQLRVAIDEQRTKMLRLKGQRDEAAVLVREVENAQRAYDLVMSRATQSSVESETTQTNVSVLKRATPPATPSSPNMLLNTALAVLAGALLAVGASIVQEIRDRRLRSDEDVLIALRQPLIGILPKKNLANKPSRSQLLLTTRRLLGESSAT